MSSIQHSLAKLQSAVGKLEGSMHGLEENLAGEQRDMFVQPAPSNHNGAPAPNGNGADNAAVAAQLDSAIEKVERILKEG